MQDQDIKLPELPARFHETPCQIDFHTVTASYLRDLLQRYAREAVRLNTSTSQAQQAEAWVAVAHALDEVAPEWTNKGRNGLEGAVAAIKELAQAAKAAPGPEPEPRPFDLEAAKRGEAVVTRDGRKVDELHHFTTEKTPHPICAIIGGVVSWYGHDGKEMDCFREDDLLMAPKPKRTVWVNIARGYEHPEVGQCGIHGSEDAARNNAKNNAERFDYIAIAAPVTIDA